MKTKAKKMTVKSVYKVGKMPKGKKMSKSSERRIAMMKKGSMK